MSSAHYPMGTGINVPHFRTRRGEDYFLGVGDHVVHVKRQEGDDWTMQTQTNHVTGELLEISYAAKPKLPGCQIYQFDAGQVDQEDNKKE